MLSEGPLRALPTLGPSRLFKITSCTSAPNTYGAYYTRQSHTIPQGLFPAWDGQARAGPWC